MSRAACKIIICGLSLQAAIEGFNHITEERAEYDSPVADEDIGTEAIDALWKAEAAMKKLNTKLLEGYGTK